MEREIRLSQSKYKLTWVLVILALWMAHGVAQQSVEFRGKIAGDVHNATTRELLPGANIIIMGTTLGTASNENGYFELSNIPAGTYSVRASVIGYAPRIIPDVVVNPVRPAELKFELVESAIELGEVNVVADYFQKLPEAPLSTQFQSYEEIRRLPGSLEDVVRAISILPGVAQVEPGRNDLIVRGGAPSENLYVVENIEVPNINHFGTQGASGGPLSFINLGRSESITTSLKGNHQPQFLVTIDKPSSLLQHSKLQYLLK